jgi:hypothetical protein
VGRFDRSGARRPRGPVVFISYRRDDSPGHAGRLRDEIVRAEFARQVFMDVDRKMPVSSRVVSMVSPKSVPGAMLVVHS